MGTVKPLILWYLAYHRMSDEGPRGPAMARDKGPPKNLFLGWFVWVARGGLKSVFDE